MNKTEWTLTEIAKLLNQPQHRLIYLCEKRVVIPDGSDARGRGSSRRFSVRNLLEFAVALTLWEFHVPASLMGGILSTLRSFEAALLRTNPGLKLPQALRIQNAPVIRALLTKGTRLYFVIGEGGNSKLIGGVELQNPQNNVNWPSVSEVSEFSEEATDNLVFRPFGSDHAFLELNITQIAKDIPIEHNSNQLKLVS